MCLGVNTYLIICGFSPYLLKVVIMEQTEIQPLNDRAALCQLRIDQCADIIKELRGGVPAGCKLSLSIEAVTIVGIDIVEEMEADLMVGFFTRWHDYYKKELRRITRRLSA